MATPRQKAYDALIRAGISKLMANKSVQKRFGTKYVSSGYKRRRVWSAPTAKTLRVPYSKGVRVGRKRQSVTFSNREFMADLKTPADQSTDFNVTHECLVNPSNAQVFSWLASIADHFEEYRIKKFKVIYEPSCTSSTTGQIAIALDYDPQDDTPTSWSQVSSWKGAKHGSAWAPLTFYADKNIRRRRVYYTGMTSMQSTTVVTTEDVRETSAAKLYICQDGITNSGALFTGGTTIGKLYVEYTVTLYIPQSNINLIAAGGYNGGMLTLLPGESAAATSMFGATFVGNVTQMLQKFPHTSGYLPFRPLSNGRIRALVPWEGYVTMTLRGTNAGKVDNVQGFAEVAGTGADINALGMLYNNDKLAVLRWFMRLPANSEFTCNSPSYVLGNVIDPAHLRVQVIFVPFPYSLWNGNDQTLADP